MGSALFHTDRRTWQQASAHMPDSASTLYLCVCFSLSSISLGLARLDQKHIKCTLPLYHKLEEVLWHGEKSRACDYKSQTPQNILLYVSNQQLNVNVSLAPAGVMGLESVCV